MQKVSIVGGSGRMGELLIREYLTRQDISLVSCICSDKNLNEQSVIEHFNISNIENKQQNSMLVFTNQMKECLKGDVIIDFSSPEGTEELIQTCQKNLYQGILIICTTALEDDLKERIKALSKKAKVALVSNTSIGFVLMRQLIKSASSALPNAEIEIVETHHSKKLDSPSGTAISLGMVIAEQKNKNLQDISKIGRSGNNKRQKDEIGFSCIRGGNVPGEHIVKFFFGSECLEISHNVFNRNCFAKGAIYIADTLANSEGRFFNDKNIAKLILSSD